MSILQKAYNPWIFPDEGPWYYTVYNRLPNGGLGVTSREAKGDFIPTFEESFKKNSDGSYSVEYNWSPQGLNKYR